MNREKEKYNVTKARYIARLVAQNSHNKNRGLTYRQAVRENSHIKASIDYWLGAMARQTADTKDGESQ